MIKSLCPVEMAKPTAAVVTLHRVHNYGSVLQTYATQRLLSDSGYDVRIIDYWRPTEVDDFDTRLKHDFARWDRNLLTRTVFRLLRKRALEEQRRRFRGFVKDHLQITERAYFTEEELEAAPPVADLYCVGSDQVWNSDYHVAGSDPFYLKFAPAGSRRVSFASSFGKPSVSAEESNYIRENLSAFEAISVRERSGVEILDHHGIDAVQLVDPTLAVAPEVWNGLVDEPREGSGYLLVYQLHRNHDLAPVVERVAKERNLKPVYLRGYWSIRHINSRNLSNTSVGEFLGLFKNAAYVVTDSFHGTAFSLNFGRPFNAIYPPNYGERIKSVMELTGTLGRAVTGESSYDTGDYDTEQVNAVLEKERQRASDFTDSLVRF